MTDGLIFGGTRLSRIVLGTVQLGKDYGIANRRGRPDDDTARAIVEAAWDAGIRVFDTAQAYGDAEARLGEILKAVDPAGESVVVTKVSPRLAPTDHEGILESLRLSAERFGRPPWAVLLHRVTWLDDWTKGLGETVEAAREEGLFRWFGVSADSPREAASALDHDAVRIIQAATNAWDHGLSDTGVLDRAHREAKLIFARSIFLQGVLLMEPATVRERLPFAAQAAERWWSLCAEFGRSPPQMALAYALGLDVPVVIGVDDAGQAAALAEAARIPPLSAGDRRRLARELSPFLNADIVTPSRWPKSG